MYELEVDDKIVCSEQVLKKCVSMMADKVYFLRVTLPMSSYCL